MIGYLVIQYLARSSRDITATPNASTYGRGRELDDALLVRIGDLQGPVYSQLGVAVFHGGTFRSNCRGSGTHTDRVVRGFFLHLFHYVWKSFERFLLTSQRSHGAKV